jgi:hypothetical protein
MATYIVAIRSPDAIQYFEIKADSAVLHGQGENQYWNLPRGDGGPMLISKDAFIFAAPKDSFLTPPC